MKKTKTYENYPAWIIILSNIFSIMIYIIGALIIYKVGVVWLVLYLLFIGLLELRLLKGHCVNCYYYAKCCAFGKGKLSALFFKKGDPKKFILKKITWKDLIPDILVSAIPMVVGIIMLIMNFNWLLLILILMLFLLTSAGNGFVRGSLACKYCKQREIGCPAEKLFDKKK